MTLPPSIHPPIHPPSRLLPSKEFTMLNTMPYPIKRRYISISIRRCAIHSLITHWPSGKQVVVSVAVVVDIFKLRHSTGKKWHNHEKLSPSEQQPIHPSIPLWSIRIGERKNQKDKNQPSQRRLYCFPSTWKFKTKGKEVGKGKPRIGKVG